MSQKLLSQIFQKKGMDSNYYQIFNIKPLIWHWYILVLVITTFHPQPFKFIQRFYIFQGFNLYFSCSFINYSYFLSFIFFILTYFTKTYTKTYMNEMEILSALHELSTFNGPTLTSLISLRDNLLISLISQLSYNRSLISKFCFQTQSLLQSRENDHLKMQIQSESLVGSSSTKKQVRRMDRKIMKNYSCARRKVDTIKNDTKNIPKNYGKAILSYILKSSSTSKVVAMYGLSLPQFIMIVKKMKNKINSIEGLRKMWGSDDPEDKCKKCIRILSYQFMRKHCLRYIFCSKVRNFGTHVKYRQKLIEGIENPAQFSHIKDY